MNKYIKLTGVLLVLVLAFLFFYPVERFVRVSCPKCSNDLNVVSDCVAYFDEVKNTPDFLKIEKGLGISNNKINETEKVIYSNDNTVQCRYGIYGPIL